MRRDHEFVVASLAHARAEPEFLRQVDAECAASRRHIDLMGTVSDAAPAVEADARVRAIGGFFRDSSGRPNRDAIRIRVRGKGPGDASGFVVDVNLCAVHVRVDQEQRLPAADRLVLAPSHPARAERELSGIRRQSVMRRSATPVPPREVVAGPCSRAGFDLDAGTRCIEAVPGIRTDRHLTRNCRVSTGNQALLRNVVRLEPSGSRIGRHRAPVVGFVIPAPEHESLMSQRLGRRGLQDMRAPRRPIEARRGRHALPVDDDLQPGRVGLDHGSRRRLSVQSCDAVHVALRQSR